MMMNKELDQPILDLIHTCHACGVQFDFACKSELQEKLKNHKHCCKGRRVHKKGERTRQFQQSRIALYMHDAVSTG